MNAAAARRWHVTEIRIPLHLIDMGEVIYHGNYIELYQVARDQFLRDAGYPYARLISNERHLAVIELNCKYRKGVGYDQLVEIRTGISALNKKRLLVHHEMVVPGQVKNVVHNTAQLTLLSVDLDLKPAPLPDDFVDTLNDWSNG